MNNQLQKLLENLVPFMVFGIGIALFIGLLLMFSYILVWGVIIGAILWLIATAKHYLFPGKSIKKDQGRIIEHEDEDEQK